MRHEHASAEAGVTFAVGVRAGAIDSHAIRSRRFASSRMAFRTSAYIAIHTSGQQEQALQRRRASYFPSLLMRRLNHIPDPIRIVQSYFSFALLLTISLTDQ